MAVSRRAVTVLFADVVGSTPLGERLDPEPLRRVLTRFFERSCELLERYGGTVEKFIGDAIMAVFGIPELHEDDALRAVRAAAEMREMLATLNVELEEELGVRLAVRIGINTGEVVTGDGTQVGTLVTGDAVNVAKRLEEAGTSGEILVGAATERLVRSSALLEPVDPIPAKGKAQPVEAWRLLAAIAGMPAISRRFDIPLLGREDELAQLRDAYARAVAERRCVQFTVLGAAGIGKSRLAAELFELVRGEAMVVVGRCLAYGKGITFWPVNEALRELGGASAVEELFTGDDDGDLVRARLEGLKGRAPASRAQETFWAFRRVCENVARRRPLVLCFEDVHWAEPTFLDLVEYLAGWIRDAPVLLLCLARPELVDQRPRFTAATPDSASLSLQPLTRDDAAAMADALGIDVDRERIVETAEGNPLFVEQLAAVVAEGGRLDAIPPTLHALLAARLDRLDTGERGAIERAAVVGREFAGDAIAHMTPADERSDLGRALFSLVRKGLIHPVRSNEQSHDRFRFGHALVRDAAYAALSKERRAELHERFAGWLDGVDTTSPLELEEIRGYHLEQVHRYRSDLGAIDDETRRIGERAGELLGKAGQRAFARGDAPAAVNLLARAATLLPTEHSTRLHALPQLGSALMRTGDFGRADEVLAEAVDAASAAGDKRLELRAVIDREFFRTFTSPQDSTTEIVRVAEAAMPLLEQLGDDLGLAKAWWLRSEAEVNAGRWAARAAALERALEYSRRSSDARDEATLTALLAQALVYGPTPVPDAITRCEELRAEAHAGARDGQRASIDRGIDAAIAIALAELRAMQGEFEEARASCAHARELYDELGLRFMRATQSLAPAAVELLAGDPDAAVEELRWGYDALEAMGERGIRSTVAAFLAQALVAAGRYDEAEELSLVSEELAAAADVVTQVVWRAARAPALARRGDDARAEELARQAVDLAETTDFLDLQGEALLALADVLRVAGRGEEASPLVRDARESYARKGNVVAALRTDALLAELAAR
jgi:class 3 adenylate cyclase/tetratricopeptide (TPR) repeat protein